MDEKRGREREKEKQRDKVRDGEGEREKCKNESELNCSFQGISERENPCSPHINIL